MLLSHFILDNTKHWKALFKEVSDHPLVKTFSDVSLGSIPGWGTKIPQAKLQK